MSDVIDLGGKKLTEQELQQKEQEANRAKFEAINTDRVAGLERADTALQRLQDGEGLAEEAVVERRLRDLEAVTRGLATAANALNALVDVIAHDLMQVIMNMEKQNASGILQAAHLQSAIDVLKTKGTVTDEELKEAFQALLPQIKRKVTNS